MFELIAQMQELLKSYYIALRYDVPKANQMLQTINDWRLKIAIDAEMRQIFWEKVTVPANATGFSQNVWFTRDDAQWLLKRGLAALDTPATISAVNQGNRQRIFTREFLNWKQIFSQVSTTIDQNNIMFDYPSEILFAENETLGLTIQGQTNAGFIYHHGANLRDTLEKVKVDELKDEIASYLPEPQLVPIIYQFPSNVAGTEAVNATGGTDIFSVKNAHSVILTEVCASNIGHRVTLIDNARDQLICNKVDVGGFSGDVFNRFETFRKLPYPHILRRGDRFRLNALNKSDLQATTTPANTLVYLVFKGYTM